MPKSVTVLGRGDKCDLRIPVESVSKRHCQLHYDGKVLNIRDLGSRNGTMVNGRTIEQAVLNPGDHIEIGPLKFTVQIDGKTGSAAQNKPAPAEPADEGGMSQEDIDAMLDDIDGIDEGSSFDDI